MKTRGSTRSTHDVNEIGVLAELRLINDLPIAILSTPESYR
jgi:hypothetical protein